MFYFNERFFLFLMSDKREEFRFVLLDEVRKKFDCSRKRTGSKVRNRRMRGGRCSNLSVSMFDVDETLASEESCDEFQQARKHSA